MPEKGCMAILNSTSWHEKCRRAKEGKNSVAVVYFIFYLSTGSQARHTVLLLMGRKPNLSQALSELGTASWAVAMAG